MKHWILSLFLFLPAYLIAQEETYTRQEYAVTDTLQGTLYLPNSAGPHPLVVLIAGSGPTDRNGNQPRMTNNSLAFLAEGLAQKNIAVYSYDKRIIALMSNPHFNERDLVFEDFIRDASTVIRHFQKDSRFNRVIPAGHSEGSLIGMVAAAQTHANAFISIAGAGNCIDVVLEEQINKQAPILSDDLKKSLKTLKQGDTLTSVNPMLLSLLRPSVQPYMISWLQYDPQKEIAKLTVPTMITQGTKDLQVSVHESELLKEAQPKARYVLIENMNHVLKEILTDEVENKRSYTNETLPVIPVLIDQISAFIHDIEAVNKTPQRN